jgi:hypothetical protein
LEKGPTVACVLRSGGVYKPEHVHTLLDNIEEHWPVTTYPLRIVVLTDMAIETQWEVIPLSHKWPRWWSKMELFAPDLHYLGDILYFDLDTTIVGSLAEIAAERRLTLLEDFFRPEKLGSGLMRLPVEERSIVWPQWMASPESHMRKFRGDQEFIAPILLTDWEVQRWQQVLPRQVVSYKVHVKAQGQVPEGARVVCFHGRPKPWQLKGGLPR